MNISTSSKIKGLIAGFIIGFFTTLIGSFIYVTLIMQTDFWHGINVMKLQGDLGKIVTLGAVLNIIAFFALLKYRQEMMARGVIFATIVLTIITLFI